MLLFINFFFIFIENSISIIDKPIPLLKMLTGCRTTFKYRKAFPRPDKEFTEIDTMCEIQIEPGTLPGEIIESPFYERGIGKKVFVIVREKEEKSPTFVRHGIDLIHIAYISMVDYLEGCDLTIPTLDGDMLPLYVKKSNSTGSYHRFPGRGLPDKKQPPKRGDLLVLVQEER